MTNVSAPDQTPGPERSSYWDAYYARSRATTRPLPSQFAVFVATELDRPHRVIELGCGSGRDAVFFASYGHAVVGVDGSVQAVAACRELAAGLGESAEFVSTRIDDAELPAQLLAGASADQPAVVYARFFVHAITDAEEQNFLDLAAAVTRPGDRLAVEYRTVRDQSGAKTTEQHYRRFVSPAVFQARAQERGFEVGYAVEGFGFAKYRSDDAYVARAILTRR